MISRCPVCGVVPEMNWHHTFGETMRHVCSTGALMFGKASDWNRWVTYAEEAIGACPWSVADGKVTLHAGGLDFVLEQPPNMVTRVSLASPPSELATIAVSSE